MSHSASGLFDREVEVEVEYLNWFCRSEKKSTPPTISGFFFFSRSKVLQIRLLPLTRSVILWTGPRFGPVNVTPSLHYDPTVCHVFPPHDHFSCPALCYSQRAACRMLSVLSGFSSILPRPVLPVRARGFQA